MFDNTTTIKEVISGSGGGAVYPQGSGTLILGAQNTYTAGTYLQGTLTVQLDTDTTITNGTIASGPLGTGVVHFQGSEQLLASGARTLANSVNIQTTSPVTLAGSDGSSSLMLSPAGLTTASDFTLQANASLVVSTPTTVKEAISGGFSLSKSGTSTLTLSAANTYTGTTTISAGKLLVANSSGSGTGTGAITVASGGTLGGTGTFTGAVTVASGGTLAPGTGATSTGILTTGNVTLASGHTFASVLNGTTAGSGYDQLSVPSGKDLTLGGSTLAITCGPSFNPAVGNVFTLIINAGSVVSGTFSGLAGGRPSRNREQRMGRAATSRSVMPEAAPPRTWSSSQVPGLTTTTLSTASANPAQYGQPVSLTATISGLVAYGLPPVGEAVTFLDGGVAIGTGLIVANGPNGVATLSAASLSAGTVHTLTAVYGGDTNLVGSNSNALVQTVEQGSTVTTIVSSANPAPFGENVAFTATVTAGSPGAGMPTGVVTFLEGANTLGTAPLSSGMATWAASSLSIGSQDITAVYGGDGNFTGTTSAPLVQSISQDGTTTTVYTAANPTVAGQQATFIAVVSPDDASITATGTVTFDDGGTSLGTAALDGTGTATFTMSSLDVAGSPHLISAVYGGDSNFTGSVADPVQQFIMPATTTTISVPAGTTTFGDGITLTATVAGQDFPAATPTGMVAFMDSGISLARLPHPKPSPGQHTGPPC